MSKRHRKKLKKKAVMRVAEKLAKSDEIEEANLKVNSNYGEERNSRGHKNCICIG